MPVELCWSCRKLKDDVRLCGDDRLCRSCDVENERKLAEIRAKQSVDAVSSTKTRAASNKMQNKVAPKNKSGKPDDKKAVTVLSDASMSGAPNYVCVLCCSNITGREHVKCDICDGVFHIDCTGIPDGAKITFLQIAESVGWTCNSCRITARINIPGWTFRTN